MHKVSVNVPQLLNMTQYHSFAHMVLARKHVAEVTWRRSQMLLNLNERFQVSKQFQFIRVL